MSVTRVFRVSIHPELRDEFERKFATISVHVAESAAGNESVTILKPTAWDPDEYAMISRWIDEESLEKFAGKNWNEAVIPTEMERYISNCSVHHYMEWD
jgi:heme-degrading monooxygenase HmoA